MAREIERKFLVRDTAFLVGKVGEPIIQGYVAKESGAMSTRVRIRGDKAYLTLKGAREGISRDEFEYPIPVADAMQILSRHCGNRLVQKTRYCVGFADLMFEVDVFGGKHAGLVIAEVELHSENQPITLPPWVSIEVSSDPRYGNFALAQFEGPLRPFDPGRVAPPKFVVPVATGFADAH
jgi:CYTH domain-containing protein